MKFIFKACIYLMFLTSITACKAETETINLTLLVFNYDTVGLANLKINDKGNTNVQAADRLGSIGEAGTACCAYLDPNSQTAKVSFFTDKGDGYKQYKITVPVQNLNDSPRNYAVLHYFPNNTGVIEVSMRRPSFRKDLFENALGEKAKGIELDSPTMWNSIPENEAARIQFPD